MRRSSSGNPHELAVRVALREAGYLIASRRHEPGPGDELGIRPGEIALLVEVKGVKAGPFGGDFSPEDRRAMLALYFVEPMLAWRFQYQEKPGGRWLWGIAWMPPDDWPPS